MPELGSHADFIIAAYGVTFVAVAVLASFVVADDRKQRRLLAELEARGIRRRSAPSTSRPSPTGKPVRKRSA